MPDKERPGCWRETPLEAQQAWQRIGMMDGSRADTHFPITCASDDPLKTEITSQAITLTQSLIRQGDHDFESMDDSGFSIRIKRMNRQSSCSISRKLAFSGAGL